MILILLNLNNFDKFKMSFVFIYKNLSPLLSSLCAQDSTGKKRLGVRFDKLSLYCTQNVEIAIEVQWDDILFCPVGFVLDSLPT